MGLTSKLLIANPEYYTIWNHRRRVLKHHFQAAHAAKQVEETSLSGPSDEPQRKDAKQIEYLISEDLQFLVPLLIEYPKCYWIWNHRRWLLQQVPLYLSQESSKDFWAAEFGLVSKMLLRDNRNFHGWGYRRKVVQALENLDPSVAISERSMARSELDYTTRMIKVKLENFSAWHTRSRLIPRMLGENRASGEERKAMLDKGAYYSSATTSFISSNLSTELSWIQDGIYTDPYNQSLWFYHHNLMCTFDQTLASQTIAPNLTNDERMSYVSTEIDNIIEAREGAEDCKYVSQTLIELVTLYSKLSDGQVPPQAQNGTLKKWFQELRSLDPKRRGRWDDLVKDLDLDV